MEVAGHRPLLRLGMKVVGAQQTGRVRKITWRACVLMFFPTTTVTTILVVAMQLMTTESQVPV